MNDSVQIAVSPVVLLIGAALFSILFTVILTTLRRAEAFPPGANLTLAICTALLAVIGIMRTFGQVGETAKSSGGSWLDLVLLPYTAMALAMLLALLFPLNHKRSSLSKGEPKCQQLLRSRCRGVISQTTAALGRNHGHRCRLSATQKLSDAA